MKKENVKLLATVVFDFTLILMPFFIWSPVLVSSVMYIMAVLTVLSIFVILLSEEVRNEIIARIRPTWWVKYDIITDVLLFSAWLYTGWYSYAFIILVYNVVKMYKMPELYAKNECDL